MSPNSIPPNWPHSLPYLTHNVWALDIPAIQRTRYLHRTVSEAASEDDIPVKKVTVYTGPCPDVEIRTITEKSHPAFGQKGLYAKKRISPFSFLLDYRGTIQSSSNVSLQSDYTLLFDGDLTIDAQNSGNEARFINDFHKISSRPNAAFDTYRDATTGEVRVGVWALNQCIEPGQRFWSHMVRIWNKGGKEWDDAWDEGEQDWVVENGEDTLD
ncbi:uncharacterized protein SPPG_08288 [Spizellomyces punctatus DAOM BR117]|uniref:SET domain-containing protein n=1 Tax=Spizellomyces punctatus (strain DAOM BR117) TaxID=645134 RepID=A0A0L0H5Y6_SPIPD|nr:uncharacterized protein SPPG_08288 [Spizellomyces punctatus DAOM BR117]KNC96389.1 hypothetical protein SPPG_08288 [Spizellomyces punctatus DAOM BR117]|eukprot:XP_016604429.1 hypothetical protein SPPG_08288 [Spizellomyces punctatus DAOM BR117]